MGLCENYAYNVWFFVQMNQSYIELYIVLIYLYTVQQEQARGDQTDSKFKTRRPYVSLYFHTLYEDFRVVDRGKKCELKKQDSLKIGRGGLKVSKLFFADDLILKGRANGKNYRAIMDVMYMFCCFSRQKVNKDKSKIFFSPNVAIEGRQRIVEGFDI